MRLRCRFGIHDWEHLGYHVYRDTSWGFSILSYRVFRKCSICGKRKQSGSHTGVPPDVRVLKDGTYVDYSRKDHE